MTTFEHKAHNDLQGTGFKPRHWVCGQGQCDARAAAVVETSVKGEEPHMWTFTCARHLDAVWGGLLEHLA